MNSDLGAFDTRTKILTNNRPVLEVRPWLTPIISFPDRFRISAGACPLPMACFFLINQMLRALLPRESVLSVLGCELLRHLALMFHVQPRGHGAIAVRLIIELVRDIRELSRCLCGSL